MERERRRALARRGDDGLWTQRLWGEERPVPRRRRTASSGTCRRSGRFSTTSAGAALERETAAVLERTAVVEDGLANWPPSDRRSCRARTAQIRVQWCAGAPGIVVAADDYIDEELLLAGAELRGTPGRPARRRGRRSATEPPGTATRSSKTFARTGDERWLERARRFAMHALSQVERLRAERGRGRYSLWTGDLGVALFAADCLDARSAYPVLGATL